MYYSLAMHALFYLSQAILFYKQSKQNKTQLSVLNEKTEIDNEDTDDHKKLNQLIEMAESNNSAFYLKFQEVFPDFKPDPSE